MDSDERVKSRLSQTLTRGARSDSNSRPVMQISSSLPSRYAPGNKKPILANLLQSLANIGKFVGKKKRRRRRVN